MKLEEQAALPSQGSSVLFEEQLEHRAGGTGHSQIGAVLWFGCYFSPGRVAAFEELSELELEHETDSGRSIN